MSDTATAREIAELLNVSRGSVHEMLQGIVPTAKKLVASNVAFAWDLAALPPSIVSRIQAAAGVRGFSTIAEALAAVGTRSTLKEPAVVRAEKLRSALREPLAKQHDLSRQQLRELGLIRYRQEFGREISGKQWDRIFDRVVKEAGVDGDFERISLYMARQSRVKSTGTGARELAGVVTLQGAIEWWKDREHPTSAEKNNLFHAAFQCFSENVRQTWARRALLQVINRLAPSVAESRDALRKAFERKLNQWDGSLSSLDDQRPIASGFRRRPDFCVDEEKIAKRAVVLGGTESLAYRQLRDEGELSPEFVGYYEFNVRENKSYVPHKVRDSITPIVEAALPGYRGPRQGRLNGPYFDRDWSGVEPGDWFSADDVTLPVYYYRRDETGVVHVERGETLLLIDLRTGYPIAFLLISGKYNAQHIRNLISAGHDAIGLPRKGLYLERGVWEARTLDGTNRQTFLRFGDTQAALARLQLQVRHATTPQAKTIEGLFHHLQDRMRAEPGFAGFNEREERFENVQKQIARARAGKIDPADYFMEKEQWARRISEIFSEFATEPQNGKLLPGISPAEAFGASIKRSPLVTLPQNARHILATDCAEKLVTVQGIRMKIGSSRYIYADENSARFLGQRVFAYFNFENPDSLTITDKKHQEFFTVKRISLPAMDATAEQFAQARAQKKAHMQPASALIGSIKHSVVSRITHDSRYSEQETRTGEFHRQAEDEARAVANKAAREHRTLLKRQAELRAQLESEGY